MARSVRDNTNVYRFKTTHKGVYLTAEEYRAGKRGVYTGHVQLQGQPFEDIKLHGLYNNRIAWSGWVPEYGSFKLERQQLGISDTLPFELKWWTIETKYYEEGEQQ